MYLTLDKKGTLYEQIARAIKMEILEGRVLAGSKLPSTRTLATALGVARKSVLQAYDLLCAEELAIARAGSGTRVAKVNPAARPADSDPRRPRFPLCHPGSVAAADHAGRRACERSAKI